MALVWELATMGNDAPRLFRAAIRRLEADPASGAADPVRQSAAMMSAGRWIAGAVLAGAALIAGALLLA
ncbi:MAG TPA: hypothetical protein VM657_09560 [Sphingomonas sp.]|nr:hypothetical protein [Sphingomonas sp.]